MKQTQNPPGGRSYGARVPATTGTTTPTQHDQRVPSLTYISMGTPIRAVAFLSCNSAHKLASLWPQPPSPPSPSPPRKPRRDWRVGAAWLVPVPRGGLSRELQATCRWLPLSPRYLRCVGLDGAAYTCCSLRSFARRHSACHGSRQHEPTMTYSSPCSITSPHPAHAGCRASSTTPRGGQKYGPGMISVLTSSAPGRERWARSPQA